jgi:hypothetical protein
MLNKRGYSYGAEFPYHFECRGPTHQDHALEWAVFHAGTDKDEATGLNKWDASKLCLKLNGDPKPNIVDIDLTP